MPSSLLSSMASWVSPVVAPAATGLHTEVDGPSMPLPYVLGYPSVELPVNPIIDVAPVGQGPDGIDRIAANLMGIRPRDRRAQACAQALRGLRKRRHVH